MFDALLVSVWIRGCIVPADGSEDAPLFGSTNERV